MAATYSYKPISPEPRTIRLLRLFKAVPTDPIRCELFEASLHEDDGITYQALSYTWGSNAVTGSITVDEERAGGGRISSALNVTTNLHTALRYIRSRYLDLVLWIDAICIDQGNPQEKSVQIGQMRLVYEKAEEVLIWLGHGSDENVEAAMDAMCRLHEEACADRKAWKDSTRRREIAGLIFRRQFARVPDSAFARYVEAFKELLARPWFQRVWIIQEVASARSASVLFGSRSAPAAIFALMPALLEMEVGKHTQAVLDILPGHSRQESWWNKRRDLLYLLKMFASARTSEPRDGIYALLGISSDASSTDVFYPDYTISYEEALRNTLSFFLFGSTSQSVHNKIWLPTLSQTALAQFADEPTSLVLHILRLTALTRHYSTTKVLLSHHGLDFDGSVLPYVVKTGRCEEVLAHAILHAAFDYPATYQEREKLLQAASSMTGVVTTELLLERAGIAINTETLEPISNEKSEPTNTETIAPTSTETLASTSNEIFEPLTHYVMRRRTTLSEQKDPNTALLHQLNRSRIFSSRKFMAVPLQFRKEVEIPHIGNLHMTCLESATSKNDVDDLVSLIYYCGVDPGSYRDVRGGTLLFLAVSKGALSVVHFLLGEMGGRLDVNSKDCDGRTALSFAAEEGRLNMLLLLAWHGADVAAKDDSGRSIVDWLEDPAGKMNSRAMKRSWGSRLAEWRTSLYGCDIVL